MTEYLTEVAAVSSKGQIVLPKSIRDSLSLHPGARLMILCDGENILMKPIQRPDLSEFRAMMDQSEKWAKDIGMKKADIDEAVRSVRQARRKPECGS